MIAFLNHIVEDRGRPTLSQLLNGYIDPCSNIDMCISYFEFFSRKSMLKISTF